jgi:hypothetical protein
MLKKLNDKFQENLSRPGIIDARVRYRAAARRLRNTALDHRSRWKDSYFGLGTCRGQSIFGAVKAFFSIQSHSPILFLCDKFNIVRPCRHVFYRWCSFSLRFSTRTSYGCLLSCVLHSLPIAYSLI